MLLAKAGHCLLLCFNGPCGVAHVVRSQVGLRERGGLWTGDCGALIGGTRDGGRRSYGMLGAVVGVVFGLEIPVH